MFLNETGVAGTTICMATARSVLKAEEIGFNKAKIEKKFVSKYLKIALPLSERETTRERKRSRRGRTTNEHAQNRNADMVIKQKMRNGQKKRRFHTPQKEKKADVFLFLIPFTRKL